MQDIIYCIIV